MGLLDQLAGSVLGQSGDTGSPSQAGIFAAIMSLISQQEGGLGGLVSQFQSSGLTDIVNSWVGRGDNIPVSAEQIQSVLGNEQIAGIASKLGIDSNLAASELAQLLPQVIDKLTPDGSLENSGPLNSAVMDTIKGQLFR